VKEYLKKLLDCYYYHKLIRTDTDIHDAVKLCVDNNLNGLVFVKMYDLEWKIKKEDTFNYSNIRINQL